MCPPGGSPRPILYHGDAKLLTKQQFVSKIRMVLASLGLPDNEYAGHSFRTGAATSADLAGVKDSTIQLLGRWKSAAFLRYIRSSQVTLASVSATLASQARGDTCC